MSPNDFQQFRDLLDGVYDFYGKRPNNFHRDIWWQAMQAYDYAAVADAMNRHLMNPDTGQFLPKPADIVKMIRGTTTDSALVALAKVEESIRKVGPYDSVAFDDPLINRVIQDMGGWIKLCEVAVLNEQQATLLLTYMRNNAEVRRFKKRLVRAFYELLSEKRQPAFQVPQTMAEAHAGEVA